MSREYPSHQSITVTINNLHIYNIQLCHLRSLKLAIPLHKVLGNALSAEPGQSLKQYPAKVHGLPPLTHTDTDIIGT